MPFALLIIGVVLLVAAVRGTHAQLFALLKNDFGGDNSFAHWAVAIAVIGGLGYIESLRKLSRAALLLVLLALLLNKQAGTTQAVNVIKKFMQQFFQPSPEGAGAAGQGAGQPAGASGQGAGANPAGGLFAPPMPISIAGLLGGPGGLGAGPTPTIGNPEAAGGYDYVLPENVGYST